MSERRVIDISVMLSPDTPVWPGDTPFSCLWTWNIEEGSSVNVSAVTSSPHAGTHADTPLHITRAAAGSESLAIEAFQGPAVVVDVTDLAGEIAIEEIDRRTHGFAPATRLLLKTGRSIATGVFPESWPRLSVDCARNLVTRGVVLVGMDCPSADDRDSKTLEVHHELLDRGVCVLENLDLREVEAGEYVLDHGVCVLENLDLREAEAGEYVLDALPMKVAGLDAAPVRAVLSKGTRSDFPQLATRI